MTDAGRSKDWLLRGSFYIPQENERDRKREVRGYWRQKSYEGGELEKKERKKEKKGDGKKK